MHPLWLLVAASWLTAAAGVGSGVDLHANASVTPLHESRLMTELLLRGFVLQVILGIAMRRVPGPLRAVPPLSNRNAAWLFAALNVTVLAWVASQRRVRDARHRNLRQAADIALGAELLLATHWLGIVGGGARRPAGAALPAAGRDRVGGAAWFTRCCWSSSVLPGWETRTLYEEGAVRHVFMLGFMAPLMVAIAHLVLERFGTGRVLWRNALTTAFFFVAAAWPLRVVPAIRGRRAGRDGRNIMGVAAAFLTVGLALFAAVCLRNAFAFARPDTGHSRQVR